MERMTRNPMTTTTMMRKWMSRVFIGQSSGRLFRENCARKDCRAAPAEMTPVFSIANYRILFYFIGKRTKCGVAREKRHRIPGGLRQKDESPHRYGDRAPYEGPGGQHPGPAASCEKSVCLLSRSGPEHRHRRQGRLGQLTRPSLLPG